MRHWYVYHAEESMGRRYGRPTVNRAFSTVLRKKLCFNDRIWVVEGVGQSPKRFMLAASFIYADTHYQPFPFGMFGSVDGKFECAYSGPGECFEEKLQLDPESLPWFAKLHSRYITKQRFFDDISGHTEIVNGLTQLAGEGSVDS